MFGESDKGEQRRGNKYFTKKQIIVSSESQQTIVQVGLKDCNKKAPKFKLLLV